MKYANNDINRTHPMQQREIQVYVFEVQLHELVQQICLWKAEVEAQGARAEGRAGCVLGAELGCLVSWIFILCG